MSLFHNIEGDGDTESLIRKCFKAGVMMPVVRGNKIWNLVRQKSVTTAVNIMLNELDKELEARELRFTRNAEDCVISVRSEASAMRVMRTVTEWIQRKIGLKVK